MIDGVCLTIVTKTADVATFDIMQPTYATTIVQQYQIGQAVNLEKAMLATDRFDGHIVSGHVDGMAQVTQVAQIEDTVLLTFKPEQSTLRQQIVPKGAITVSGVSLTVVTCATDTFMPSYYGMSYQCSVVVRPLFFHPERTWPMVWGPLYGGFLPVILAILPCIVSLRYWLPRR